MRRLAPLALVAFSLAATLVTSADARMAAANCNRSIPARAELACAQANLRHAENVLGFLHAYPEAGTPSSRARVYRDFRWLRRLGLDRVAEAKARLVPPIAHWSLWSCITNGAYPGAPHEGNGYNGSYTGPLGMTIPWAGHSPSTGDWVTTPRAEVYAYAEQEYRENGYSTAWLRGQWPATSPPCLYGRA